jgi:type II secretory pathway predicted ATPase ExeA
MYESFYGLSRRPFSATPDPGCWFRCSRYQAALDELLVCAEQGQGIGILIAPAGAGKTLLCERLIREIGEPFTSVLLRHATYNTRRGFLQTLLCELAQPYDMHTDQELRLGLAPVLKGLHQQGRALLLVVDEAHQLSETLLEELRILADQAEDGRPIVRLVLAGQFGLEEKLAHPTLQALTQRVRAQVPLEPMSLAESTDYIDFRMTWGGGRTTAIFTDEAIAAITRAADGVPRCLNQLCDHALLLGYVNEQRPVTAETVAAALEDLRHLPLPWNLSGLHAGQPLQESATSTTLEWDATTTEPMATEVMELPLSLEDVVEWSDEDVGVVAAEPEADPLAGELPPMPIEPQVPLSLSGETMQEELVYDRYNALDAGLEPLAGPSVPSTVSSGFGGLPFTVTTALFGSAVPPTERLDVIQDLLDAVHSIDDPDRTLLETAQIGRREEPAIPRDWDDDLFELAGRPPMVGPIPDPMPSSVFEFGTDPITTSEPAAEAVGVAPSEPRDCRNLFTRLRRKQMGR